MGDFVEICRWRIVYRMYLINRAKGGYLQNEKKLVAASATPVNHVVDLVYSAKETST